MQIQLKQAEIVDAVKDYVAKHGFNLAGKVVDVTFIAGRGDKGLVADISIEELDIPGIDNADAEGEAAKPTLTVVQAPAADQEAPAKVEDPQPETPDAETAPAAKTTSLFA